MGVDLGERLKVADLRQPNTPNYPVLSVRYEIDSGYTFSGGQKRSAKYLYEQISSLCQDQGSAS